ncbi:hypothetical protein SAMN04490248_11440 [Salinihabitans flavidus]|uniref:DUF721 domain-containing protein n=1 Tax=Salinihabitans flavidus TaxID=569882 RepID=A0A1H8T4R3_9RHOB|nr:DUF721 domain-containing protein [Salinihabitans flavidus]SEO85785.1 hypothetical protein SAMN04490248_11440 [Salinihabitans flavidus]
MRKDTTNGFKRTSSLLRERIRKAGESRGFAVTKVLTHWPEIVGEDMARICKPVDVKYGRQGFGATLTVLTTGAQAPMLEMQKETLRKRVNAAYGYNAIARLRITQTAPTGFAEGQAMFTPKPPRQTPAADPGVTRAASEVTAGFNDDALRTALERLAQNVFTKAKR